MESDPLTIGRSGMPGLVFLKCRGVAYRSASLTEIFNNAMWITPNMTLLERLQKHLDSGTIGTMRAGKSSITSVDGMGFFVTFYCGGQITDTGAHGNTFDLALERALNSLDLKVKPPPLSVLLPRLPMPLPSPKG